MILPILGAATAVWALASAKTSRPDGTLVRATHPYRRMMPFIMPTRNESVAYFDTPIDAERLTAFAASRPFRCTVTHCLVGALGVALREVPALNRFIAGHRLYARRDRVVSFSMKRQRLDTSAKIAVVRLVLTDEPFATLCARIDGEVDRERGPDATPLDKELGAFLTLPAPVLRAGVAAFRWLDGKNLLPRFFLDGDAMFTSAFVANLGSLGMGPAYHHLYEWGNCPIFLAAGQFEERVVPRDGEPVVRPILPLRWSFDERIDDGLTARHGLDAVVSALHDPERWLV